MLKRFDKETHREILLDEDIRILSLFNKSFDQLHDKDWFCKLHPFEKVATTCREAKVRINEYIQIICKIRIYDILSRDIEEHDILADGIIAFWHNGKDKYRQIQYLKTAHDHFVIESYDTTIRSYVKKALVNFIKHELLIYIPNRITEDVFNKIKNVYE